jgi:molecular chaperone DnaJ
MNIDQAYKTLGLQNSATDEEIKKAYKSLAKKHHPDVDKDNPDKFKEINQAHDLIKDYRANPGKHSPFSRNQAAYGSVNLNDIFAGFQNHFRQSGVHRTPEQVKIQVSISFKESVLGCEKDISYSREKKCEECNGESVKRISNGCDACDGFGEVRKTRGNMQFLQSCGKCLGRNVGENTCTLCNGKGTQTEDVRGSVSIQAGRHSGDILQMRGKGNFVEANMFGEQYTDVFIQIIVMAEDGLELIDNDVVSNIEISLKEAFTGCEKAVKTIDGERTISIGKSTHHKDEVRIPGMGVKERNGDQRVIVNVKYPNEETISALIGIIGE